MEQLPASLSDSSSFVKLCGFIESRRNAEPGGDFEQFERELAEHMHMVESEIKAAELTRYDVDADTILVGGQEWQKCLEGGSKTYLGSSGPVTVERNLYRPAGGGKSICPLELRAGIIGGLYTPMLARQVCFIMGQMTSVETAKLFKELAIKGPSSSSCDRLPKIVNEVWERNRVAWEGALRAQESVPAEAAVMAVSLDGVMVPDKEAQRKAKLEREAKKRNLEQATGGPAGYREVGCGTVSLYDVDSERLGTVRYGREPEYKKKTLTEQLDAEVASILAARPDLDLVALADGAEENWRYFDGPIWEQATKIVDVGHACEHLRAGLVAYYGAKDIAGRADYERLKIILKDKDGGVDEVISELQRLERRLGRKKRKKRQELVLKERKYFENQRSRMDYARYQRLGLPIGSGIVEASCKTLAAQRLKRSGMSWGNGKQSILTIRSLQQSNRWERGWRLAAEEFQVGVLILKKHGHLTAYAHAS